MDALSNYHEFIAFKINHGIIYLLNFLPWSDEDIKGFGGIVKNGMFRFIYLINNVIYVILYFLLVKDGTFFFFFQLHEHN